MPFGPRDVRSRVSHQLLLGMTENLSNVYSSCCSIVTNNFRCGEASLEQPLGHYFKYVRNTSINSSAARACSEFARAVGLRM